MFDRRVVITGLGCLTPVGLDVDTYWNSIKEGKSGVVRTTRFDPETFQSQVSGQIMNYDSSLHFDKKEQRKIELFVQYAIVAGRQAMKDSGLDLEKVDPCRIGCYIGSGTGGITMVEEQQMVLANKGNRRVSPLLIPKMICNMAAGMVSMDLGVKGPNECVVTACAAATHAIGEAMWFIKRGDADAVVAGGAESTITPLSIAGFANMHALSTKRNDNPTTASRPFDRERDGFVMGEGAGILILEELEHAKARGAKIYAEIIGYGASGDAHHMTAPAPCGEGGARAMKACLDRGKINPDEVDYINAHGTSTPLNDALETQAIKTVLGDSANNVAISSTKSMIGHLIGAGGAVEAIACIKSINEGVIHPTINYENPDPECDLDYVPNTARETEVKIAMSNSLGFGGHNCSVAFKKFE